MPFPNQHSCRIREPNLFDKTSFKTLRTKTKGLSIIVGNLKETGKSAVEAYRYNKKEWKADRASKHCNKRGGRFEVASSKKSLQANADHSFMHYLFNKLKKGEETGWSKDEIIKEHARLTDELRKSGLAMHTKSTIDDLSKEYEETVKALTPNDIPELMKPGAKTDMMGKKKKKKVKLDDVENYVTLSTLTPILYLSDLVYLNLNEEKITLVIRKKEKDIKLEEKIKEQFDLKDIEFEYNEKDASSSYIPLFDFVLLPKSIAMYHLSDKNIV
jgi:hypothetical protein